jgi:nitroreductase
MNETLHFLQQRNSAPKLTEPGPGAAELEEIFTAALRAPDHAWLQPWRFLVVAGDRRQALGQVLADALLARNPEADEAARLKAASAPLRAPTVVVVVTRLSEHPKVPHVEQRQSAACAAHAILLATEACGYAGIWRTGDAAFDRTVMRALGLADNEEITGFLYLGSRAGNAKPLPRRDTADFVDNW